MNTNVDQIARSFEYASFSAMAQHDRVPNRTRILGVGATVAALGQEFSFFRRDIHWTNVAPEYTDPEIQSMVDTDQDDNIEFKTWDLESINDIFPEEHFDRIYCHGDDLANLDHDSLRNLGRALVGILAKGGVIHIAQTDDKFIENATYRQTTRNLTYSKPQTVSTEPYMTHLPIERSSIKSRLQRYGLPKLESNAIKKPLDTVSNLAARAIMAGYRTAGAVYQHSRRKK